MDKNPIDPDKVADNPGLLPYPHHVGSPAFMPTQQGVIRTRALSVMEEQTQRQLSQIKEQIDLLARQANALQDRVRISTRIYQAQMGFEPVVSHTYFLYSRGEDQFVLSMVGTNEWGRTLPFTHYVATVRLLADHTWEVLHASGQ
jgi:hypothetical protein